MSGRSSADSRAGERAARVHRILDEGTSADRQLRVFRETGSLKAFVEHLRKETMRGVR